MISQPHYFSAKMNLNVLLFDDGVINELNLVMFVCVVDHQ